MTDKEHAEHLGDMLAKTEEQIENLKCCGNCAKYIPSAFNNDKPDAELCAGKQAEDVCDEWRWDEIIQKTRKINKRRS